jgi:hypothetical protein
MYDVERFEGIPKGARGYRREASNCDGAAPMGSGGRSEFKVADTYLLCRGSHGFDAATCIESFSSSSWPLESYKRCRTSRQQLFHVHVSNDAPQSRSARVSFDQ